MGGCQLLTPFPIAMLLFALLCACAHFESMRGRQTNLNGCGHFGSSKIAVNCICTIAFTWLRSWSWSDPSVYKFSCALSASENFEMNMFINMSGEEWDYLEGQRTKMLSLEKALADLVTAGAAGGTGGKGGGKGDGDERGRALLNRKDFWLISLMEIKSNLKVGCSS